MPGSSFALREQSLDLREPLATVQVLLKAGSLSASQAPCCLTKATDLDIPWGVRIGGGERGVPDGWWRSRREAWEANGEDVGDRLRPQRLWSEVTGTR